LARRNTRRAELPAGFREHTYIKIRVGRSTEYQDRVTGARWIPRSGAEGRRFVNSITGDEVSYRQGIKYLRHGIEPEEIGPTLPVRYRTDKTGALIKTDSGAQIPQPPQPPKGWEIVIWPVPEEEQAELPDQDFYQPAQDWILSHDMSMIFQVDAHGLLSRERYGTDNIDWRNVRGMHDVSAANVPWNLGIFEWIDQIAVLYREKRDTDAISQPRPR
jgi:hypothetical protein